MDQNQSTSEKSLFDNPISMSIIIGAIIVAGSVLVGAYMIHGGVATSTDTNPSGQGGPSAVVQVTDRIDQPSLGSATAKVVMYEFGDFQCPFCKQWFQQSYAMLKTKYIDTGKVRLVFRHFPLTSIHVNAQISSEAAECANRQGKFDAYYNALYTQGQGDGTGLDATSLKKYASQIGLNMTTFNQCLDNHETKDVVAKDLAVGAAVGVTGTPSFVIDGKLIVGAQPEAIFEQALDSALKK